MRTLTSLLVAAVFAAPVLAQPPRGGGMRGGFGGGVMLLGVEDVQKELKITDEQKTKIKDFQAKQREAMQGLFGPDADQEKRQEAFKKMQEESTKFLKDTLTDDQSKRLKQIGLQQAVKNNPAAIFADEENVKALKLTDDQKEKVKSIGDQLRKDMADLRQPGQRPSADDQKKMTALRKEASEKIMETLTAEQRKSLEEMQGKPFEGKIDFGGPGGRRPGAGGAGAGAGGRRGNPGAGAGDKKPEDKKAEEKDK